jgi:hypothetical protein
MKNPKLSNTKKKIIAEIKKLDKFLKFLDNRKKAGKK